MAVTRCWNARLLSVVRGVEKKKVNVLGVLERLLASFVEAGRGGVVPVGRDPPRRGGETLGRRRSRASPPPVPAAPGVRSAARRSARCTRRCAARAPSSLGCSGGRAPFAEDGGKAKKCAGRSGPVTGVPRAAARCGRGFRFPNRRGGRCLYSRAHFYCTGDGGEAATRLFFYRKGVWARLTAAPRATTEDEAEAKAPAPIISPEAFRWTAPPPPPPRASRTRG